MVKLIFLLLNGIVIVQLVSGQGPKTAWSAANAGLGLGTAVPPMDPTDHQINMAIVGINNAKTEAAAATAAAAIYSPALDMADNVKQALENKIRQLRTPANWPHPIPPPLPPMFDVMHVIMGAYYGTPTAAPAVPAARTPVRSGPQPGPPTAIRRGPAPGKRPSNQQPTALQLSEMWKMLTSLTNTILQQNGQLQSQQPARADWTPPASSNTDWVNPFDMFTPTHSPSLWI